jgi:co-chaperonin GroES (HSP10)
MAGYLSHKQTSTGGTHRVIVFPRPHASGGCVPRRNCGVGALPQRGVVVAVGDESDLINVAPGDRVLFPKDTGTEIRIEAVDHLIIESADLLAVLQTAPASSAAA